MSTTPLEDKIAALLRKAECTDNEHEASAFFAKAEELMIKYGIENVTTAEAKAEAVETQKVTVFDPHYVRQVDLAARVARGFNCKVFYSRSFQDAKGKYRNRSVSATVTFVGFPSDLRRAIDLFTALNLQMPLALLNWKRSDEAKNQRYAGYSDHTLNHSFMIGYLNRVGSRLQETLRAAKQEMAPMGSSTALVLVDRTKAVDSFMDDLNLGKRRATSRGTNSVAYGAGSAAGSSANLGGTGIGGNRGSLAR